MPNVSNSIDVVSTLVKQNAFTYVPENDFGNLMQMNSMIANNFDSDVKYVYTQDGLNTTLNSNINKDDKKNISFVYDPTSKFNAYHSRTFITDGDVADIANTAQTMIYDIIYGYVNAMDAPEGYQYMSQSFWDYDISVKLGDFVYYESVNINNCLKYFRSLKNIEESSVGINADRKITLMLPFYIEYKSKKEEQPVSENTEKALVEKADANTAPEENTVAEENAVTEEDIPVETEETVDTEIDN